MCSNCFGLKPSAHAALTTPVSVPATHAGLTGLTGTGGSLGSLPEHYVFGAGLDSGGSGTSPIERQMLKQQQRDVSRPSRCHYCSSEQDY